MMVWRGLWAMAERSLRLEAREVWPFIIRLVSVGICYFSFISAQSTAQFLGAPGHTLFVQLTAMNLFLVVTAAIGYFSSVITEEKEEGTLGLMLMTGLSAFGILVSKLIVRLWQAFLLLLVQLPCLLLTITLGGVRLAEIVKMVILLSSTLFFAACVAMLCSVIARNSRQASTLMTLFCFGYWLLVVFAMAATVGGPWSGSPLQMLAQQCLLGIEPFLLTGTLFKLFEANPSLPLVSWCDVFHVSAGLACLGIARLAFEAVLRQPEQETAARTVLATPRALATRAFGGNGRWRVPQRVWSAPIFWKEFYFTHGGPFWLLGRFALFVSVPVTIYWFSILTSQSQGYDRSFEDACAISLVLGGMLLPFEAANIFSRIFSDEQRNKTWATLVLTPFSLGEIAYTKVLAGFWGLLPLGSVLIILINTSEAGHRFVRDVTDETGFWAFAMYCVFGIHLATVFSLYLRWGAVAFATAALFLAFMACVLLLTIGGPRMGGDEFAAMMLIGSFVGSFFCHVIASYRLQQIAEE